MTLSQRQIKRGIWWYAGAALAVRVIDVAAMLVVIKLLAVEHLGLAALASGAIAIIEAMNGIGVGTALIRKDEVGRDELSSLMWFAVCVALLLGGVVALLAPTVAEFYGERALGALVTILCAKLVFVGATIVPQQLLVRRLRFEQIGLLQSGCTLVEAGTKISLAIAGFGAWTLVLAELGYAIAMMIGVFVFSKFVPKPRFRWQEIRWFVWFGWRAALANVCTQSYKNLDYLLIGRVLGVSALGVYKVAFDIAMKPIDAMAQPIYRVTYPVFARLSQQTEELAARFVDSSRYMLGLIAPIAVFVFVSSSDLLEVAAAERWVAAAPAIQVLCWAGLMRALTRLFDNLFFSLSRPDLALLDAVLGLVVLGATMPPLLFLLGDRFGILSVCFAWLIAYPLIFAVLFTFGQRLSPLRLSGYAKGLVPTAAAAGVMLLVLYASGRALVDEDAWTRLLAQALIALGAYAIGLRYLAGVRFHHLGFRGDQAPVAAGSNFRSASARRS